MSRPKNSKDASKRKRKTFLTSQEELNIVEDYNNGSSTATILRKYGISKGALSGLKQRRGLKTRIANSTLIEWMKINNLSKMKDVSGIYVIYFLWKYDNEDTNKHNKINDIKAYIGSSVSIGHRLLSHRNDLKKNKHSNKELQKYFNSDEYDVHYAVIERCDENKILQRERYYLNKWHIGCLINTWIAINEKEIEPWLKKASENISYSKNFTLSDTKSYNGTPCKETNYVHKSGYGYMSVTINGDTKCLAKHRVAYWEKHGKYPELVRHLCDNPKCYNADHLATGNHKDNMLDRRGDFPKEFEEKWLEFEGDLNLLSDFFKDRWKHRNQDWKGQKVSYASYEWEKKLGLREKYPEIAEKRAKR